jgi:hypothetical protein
MTALVSGWLEGANGWLLALILWAVATLCMLSYASGFADCEELEP